MTTLLALSLFCGLASAASLPCFHVRSIVPAAQNDSGRYLMDSSNGCVGYVPDVYLKLRFLLRDGSHVDAWESLHFIAPGRRWFQFAYPAAARGFYSAIVVRVATTLEEVSGAILTIEPTISPPR